MCNFEKKQCPNMFGQYDQPTPTNCFPSFQPAISCSHRPSECCKQRPIEIHHHHYYYYPPQWMNNFPAPLNFPLPCTTYQTTDFPPKSSPKCSFPQPPFPQPPVPRPPVSPPLTNILCQTPQPTILTKPIGPTVCCPCPPRQPPIICRKPSPIGPDIETVWKDVEDYEMPPGAVIGGVDKDGEPIYVGSAYHGDWLPASILPGKKCCYVSYEGSEHVKTSFQVLCDSRSSWVSGSDGAVHPNAVEGGFTSDGEKLYIGRVWHNNSQIVGKIHPSHRTCYIPSDGREIPFTNYEVLISGWPIKPFKPNKFYPPLPSTCGWCSIPKTPEDEKDKQEVKFPEQTTEILVDKTTQPTILIKPIGPTVCFPCSPLRPPMIFPIPSPTGLDIEPVWTDVGEDYEMPRGAVRGGTDKDGEPIYVGSAYHEGHWLPASILPGKKCCYVSYGGSEHVETSVQVLCYPRSSWVSGSEVHPKAVEGGRTSDGEKLYIGRVWHENSLIVGRIHPSHRTCYIPSDGKEISYANYEVLINEWPIKSFKPNKFYPPLPNKCGWCSIPRRPEDEKDEQEVKFPEQTTESPEDKTTQLTISPIPIKPTVCFPCPPRRPPMICPKLAPIGPDIETVWKEVEDYKMPPGAVIGGADSDGEPIYVGTVSHDEDWLPASILPGKKCCYVSYGGAAHVETSFQVLCDSRAVWVSGSDGSVHPNAVEGGRTSDGEKLYIGRVRHKNSQIVGKIHPSHRTCYIPADGKEIPYANYEVLISGWPIRSFCPNLPLPDRSDWCEIPRSSEDEVELPEQTPERETVEPFWKEVEDYEMPPGAVIGGADKDEEPIYVGTAYHDGDWLPASILPGKKRCYVSYAGSEHVVTSFEVLCDSRSSWVPGTDGEVHPDAVEGGRTSDGEKLYIGRVWHKNSQIVGKIHPSHRTLYIPADGKEIPCPNYEVLISGWPTKPFRPNNKTRLPPPKRKFCCNMPRLYVEKNEQEVELPQATTERDTVETVWKDVDDDYEMPRGAVRGGTDKDGEPTCVGSAYHEGHWLPGAILPGKKCCYVSYRGSEYAKTSCQVLCDSRAVWASGSDGEVHPNAVEGGHTSDGEKLYIGRIWHKNLPVVGKIHPSHRTCYIPYEGKEISNSNYEVLITGWPLKPFTITKLHLPPPNTSQWCVIPRSEEECEEEVELSEQTTEPETDDTVWKDVVDYEMPPEAVRGGTDVDGESVYVGRAFHEGDWTPAKIIPGRKCCYVSHGGLEHAKTSFQVLCDPCTKWVPAYNGQVPADAIESGKTSSGETLYIGRVNHKGVQTIGKIQPSSGRCYVPFDGKEISYTDYEVLVSERQPEPTSGRKRRPCLIGKYGRRHRKFL